MFVSLEIARYSKRRKTRRLNTYDRLTYFTSAYMNGKRRLDHFPFRRVRKGRKEMRTDSQWNYCSFSRHFQPKCHVHGNLSTVFMRFRSIFLLRFILHFQSGNVNDDISEICLCCHHRIPCERDQEKTNELFFLSLFSFPVSDSGFSKRTKWEIISFLYSALLLLLLLSSLSHCRLCFSTFCSKIFFNF